MSPDRRKAERRQMPAPVVAERRQSDRRVKERRAERRVPLDLWVEEEKGAELYFRRTGNVSLGGVFFEQSIPHAHGTRVRLRFALPAEGPPLQVAAEIVNTPVSKDGLGMGLRFVDLSDDDRKTLQAFLDDDG
jgi:uncharacterized protein (TIGR02266 family)